jgi:hypothetical protein
MDQHKHQLARPLVTIGHRCIYRGIEHFAKSRVAAVHLSCVTLDEQPQGRLRDAADAGTALSSSSVQSGFSLRLSCISDQRATKLWL